MFLTVMYTDLATGEDLCHEMSYSNFMALSCDWNYRIWWAAKEE